MIVRPAEVEDADAIAAIWNPMIRDTAVTFNSVEKSASDISDLIRVRKLDGHGFWVGFDEEEVAGFATYAQFRGGVGYAHTMEHTIILAPKAHGRGLGRRLMQVLEDHARSAGAHSMFAGVSSGNPDGVAFHAALGYAEIVTLKQVGYKFGRWFDLHLMQKFL